MIQAKLLPNWIKVRVQSFSSIGAKTLKTREIGLQFAAKTKLSTNS